MTDGTEITDVYAEVSIRDGGATNSEHYQLLACETTDHGHEPDAFYGKDVVLRLADGDSSIRIALTDEQARRLEGQLAFATQGETDE